MTAEGERMRPLILVDVDGVLNPSFSAKTRRYLEYHEGWKTCYANPMGTEFRLFLNPAHGRWLLDLAQETGAELAWGTTWEHYANKHIGPRIGLPGLPVAPMPKAYKTGGLYHKAQGFVPWTAGRPFCWLDDEPDAGEVTAKLAGSQPHKVIYVDEHTGLTQGHISQAREWLLSLHRETPGG